MKKIALVLICLLLAVYWWWPSLGSEARSFPGGRTFSELVSKLTGGGDIPAFEGAPVAAEPLPPLDMPPHPFQDNRGYAGAHADSYNSGVIAAAGPLGNDLQVHSRMSGALPTLCSTQHFDQRGRIVTMCVGFMGKSRLLLLDPEELEILAVEELPGRAGFYIRMDQQGRIVVPVGDMSLQVFEVDDSGPRPSWQRVARHDLTPVVPEALRTDYTFPLDVVADWQGNWWFTLLDPATLGYVDRKGAVHAHLFEGERVENGLTGGPSGVYVATNKGLYGMRAGPSGVEVFSRIPYESGAAAHSLSSGSGTTPVLFGEGRLIAFGDNADPRPNVLVYRTDEVPPEQHLVCRIPVFKPGRSVLENSFIGYNLSLVIENNMGFSLLGDSSRGEPGYARIDVRPDLSGCDLVWENYQVRAGTGAKLSLGSGLIYVHELLADTGWVNAWYLTAIDFRTGKMAWRKYIGSGKQWDNALLTVSIGPDGLLTTGMLAGVAAARDGR